PPPPDGWPCPLPSCGECSRARLFSYPEVLGRMPRRPLPQRLTQLGHTHLPRRQVRGIRVTQRVRADVPDLLLIQLGRARNPAKAIPCTLPRRMQPGARVDEHEALVGLPLGPGPLRE